MILSTIDICLAAENDCWNDKQLSSSKLDRSLTSARCIGNGALRLVGGLTAREGTVEICLDSTWGTVRDEFWAPQQLLTRGL